jgi:hypothetical protein
MGAKRDERMHANPNLPAGRQDLRKMNVSLKNKKGGMAGCNAVSNLL